LQQNLNGMLQFHIKVQPIPRLKRLFNYSTYNSNYIDFLKYDLIDFVMGINL
jgi:hypothetical protein